MVKGIIRLDIFCLVIDNYGDAGFCLRLARQLSGEYGFKVRLWIDKPDVLRKISPENVSSKNGFEIRRWADPFPPISPEDIPDAVIEGFGARVPDTYMEKMAEKKVPPVWINLEYLSAEDWVDSCHRMASPHPRLPLTKHFYFPGFSERAGGLLREKDLLAERDAFTGDPGEVSRFLNSIGVSSAGADQTVSLFCYPDAPSEKLFEAFRDADERTLCIVPEGVAVAALRAFTGRMPEAGLKYTSGSLTLQVVPMMPQERYDRLLWSCSINFVRGEDSFVRAQWAGKPFIWQIYRQEENAHLAKLDAFLLRYFAGLSENTAGETRRFWHFWNNVPDTGTDVMNWKSFRGILPELARHAAEWPKKLAVMPDLATGLVRFFNTLR